MGIVGLDIYRTVSGTETLVAKVNKWKFQDTAMGEQFITCTVTSEVPIDWAIGDHCEFRGETYTLNYNPSVTQKAPTNSVQDAYTYENVKFDSQQDELTRCMMLDITPTTGDYVAALGTNHTGSSRFQLYCGETTANGSTLTAVCALAAKMQANLDRLTERITNEYSVDLANPDDIERVEYSQPEADREIRELRGKIKELGPINVNVMEDYEDEKKRLLEVEAQFDDLDRARASLDRTITKLDDIARSRYLDTFARIQKNFQFVFSKLFLNGETKMSLVEKVDEMGKPMDILDADIEINVRPTGKKMRGIKALSGGEHALTATALLFAIYMEKPSPYCVLDEVDGPLDDANVGRFMALLREFSKQTLFIVVTHNKRTMAEADMLYGVTQEIKGISRIASVQLADATKFAI